MSDFEDHLIQITLTVIPNDYQHMNVRMSIDSLQYGEQVVARPSVPLEDWQIDAYRRTYNYIQSEKSLITSQRDEEYGTYLLGILFSKPEWRMAFETVLLRPSNKVFLDIKTCDPELLIYPWEYCIYVRIRKSSGCRWHGFIRIYVASLETKAQNRGVRWNKPQRMLQSWAMERR